MTGPCGCPDGYCVCRPSTPHPAATDPAVQAVAEALLDHQEARRPYPASDLLEAFEIAQVAVDAYRRAVLASRPDAFEPWPVDYVNKAVDQAHERGANIAVGLINSVLIEFNALLAALADETARAQTWEAGARDATRTAEEAIAARKAAEADQREVPMEPVPEFSPELRARLEELVKSGTHDDLLTAQRLILERLTETDEEPPPTAH